MADHERSPTEPQGVGAGHRAVRDVGKLEIAHGVEPNHPDPVGHEGVLASFGRKHSTVRMRNHLGSQPTKNDGSEMVIGMVVRQHQPPDRLSRNPANSSYQLLALLGAGECVDDDDTVAGNDKTRIGPALRASTGISNGGEHTWCQRADGRSGRRLRGRAGEDPGQANKCWWKDQAETKLMWTDCLKMAPLLSDQTMVSGASLSALRVKLTTGSRLMPEVHSNRATS